MGRTMSKAPVPSELTPSSELNTFQRLSVPALGVEEHGKPMLDSTQHDDEFDFHKSEATFRFTVDNIHMLRQSATSGATYIRGLPWKILVMPRTHLNRAAGIKSLGYFLQCNADNDSSSWSCHGTAELRILPAKEGVKIMKKKIDHVFHYKEHDWGFSNFLSWAELISPEKGFVTPDKKVTFEVHCFADAPHGLAWDSRKLTGYIGLKNHGATGYINCVLQTFFFTSALRQAVYLVPTEGEDSTNSVCLALQSVFYDLQHSDKPVGIKNLTKSFGWDTQELSMPHDVQEFFRVLSDHLDNKMKGTCVEGTISDLTAGTMISYVKCKHVEYISSREESFYDLQLNVKGNKDIYESFKEFTKPEILDGYNKFDTGNYGLQEAEKGVIFKSFPPVMYLQLLRFQYDPVTDRNIKITDRYEFPETLDLDEFLEAPDANDKATYSLHTVIIHSGDNQGGQYLEYLNPMGDGEWCKFEDEVVSRCTKEEMFLDSFGGRDDERSGHSTNAYMLVYIRKTRFSEAFCPISDEEIPESLMQKFNRENKLKAYRKKERREAHLYMTVNIITEDQFYGHQAEDLFEVERPYLTRSFRVLRQQSFDEFMQMLAKSMGYHRCHIRVWPITHRENGTLRPCTLDEQEAMNKPVFEVAEGEIPWNLWIEVLQSDSPAKTLPPFDKDNDMLIFAKMYNPQTKTLAYCGHLTVSVSGTMIRDLEPQLRRRGGLSPDTPLLLYEEIQPSLCVPIKDKSMNLIEAMDKLIDGNILVFQVDSTDLDKYQLPTATSFFEDLFHRVDVVFCNKNVTTDPGIVISLNERISYDQMAREVAKQLNADPSMLQFFRKQANREIPGTFIRSNFAGQLKDLFQVYGSRKTKQKLYYQELSMKGDEFENKRQFACIRCVYVSPNLKEEELILSVNKNSDAAGLLIECKKKMSLPPEQDIRLLEVIAHRIFHVVQPESSIDLITGHDATSKTYRIEIIPPDQKVVADDEKLINVAHFQKEIFNTFSVPFLIKIKTGEKFRQIRDRIQRVVGVADKDFEKWKLAVVVQGQAKYFEDMDQEINVKNLTQNSPAQSPHIADKVWIGLDHENVKSKSKRRMHRFGYEESSLKINN